MAVSLDDAQITMAPGDETPAKTPLSPGDSSTARTLNRVVLGLGAVAVLSLTTCIVAIADLGRAPPVLRGAEGPTVDADAEAAAADGFPAPLNGLSWPTIVKQAEA